MDLGAVKAAPRSDLAAFAVRAAANARGLLDDAELLSLAGRPARACALAVLAVEEVGKAVSMMVLSLVPAKLKGQIRVRRMLEWHELKLVGGLVLALLPAGAVPAAALVAMTRGELEEIVGKIEVVAEVDAVLKQTGFYVDMDKSGHIRGPSDVTEAEVSAQLSRARQAVAAVRALSEPTAPAMLATPPPKTVELAEALVIALADAGPRRTPEAAAGIVADAVTRLAGSSSVESPRSVQRHQEPL